MFFLHTNEIPQHTSAIVLGRMLSKMSTSFENLDRILPDGVVSKNDNGKRNIVDKSWLCKITPANQQPNTGTMSVKMLAAPQKQKIILIPCHETRCFSYI